MKITEEDLNKLSQNLLKVRLSDDQKRSMLSNIYQTAEREGKVANSPFVLASFFNSRSLTAAFAVCVFTIVGTGYAAAGSLPGQFLYGVKVNFLEPATLNLTADENLRNGYKIHLLQTRVAEMRELQMQAGITPFTEQQSYYATKKNVNALEASAIFDETGENAEVSAEVEAYNALIGESFHIETTLLKNQTKREEDKRPQETKKDDGRDLDAVVLKAEQEITETVQETLDETARATKPAEEVIEDIEEITDPATEKVEPITDILGL